MTLPANIEKRIERTETCWLWTGALTPNGYGQFAFKREDGRMKNNLAHRLVYEYLVGEPPPHLHHECRVKACVNPAHLAPLTAKEHAAIHGAEHVKDVCVNGHDMADAYIVRRGLRSGEVYREDRRCAGCMKERNARDWRKYSPEKRVKLNQESSERRRRRKLKK